jgi:hypothetical protein
MGIVKSSLSGRFCGEGELSVNQRGPLDEMSTRRQISPKLVLLYLWLDCKCAVEKHDPVIVCMLVMMFVTLEQGNVSRESIV